MTNPTSNFGWQMPTSTDLVTDLPADFETFGQAVDTSLADLKGGTTGQILSKASNTDMDFTWVANDVGDITAVTAGTGISGGGTSGAVTVTNSMATTITTKGDLVPGTGSGTFARLAVGNNGETLVADSSATTGLKWAKSPNFVGVRVYQSSNQSVSNATATWLAWNAETIDTDGFHDNSTNNTRLTVPAGLGGKYAITFQMRYIDNIATGRRVGAIQINRTTAIAVYERAGSTLQESMLTSTIYNLSAGDYIEVDAYQTAGITLNTFGDTSSTFFQMQYLGA